MADDAGSYGVTCSPSRLNEVCWVRARSVVESAIPKLPPMFLMKLYKLVALPISSRGMESMVVVVSGTNRRARQMPCQNCGQKMSQYPAARLRRERS